MSGNVWEWCQDCFSTYSSNALASFKGATGSLRVFRGGGWYDSAGGGRVSSRNFDTPTFRQSNLGFRLAL